MADRFFTDPNGVKWEIIDLPGRFQVSTREQLVFGTVAADTERVYNPQPPDTNAKTFSEVLNDIRAVAKARRDTVALVVRAGPEQPASSDSTWILVLLGLWALSKRRRR